MERTSELSIPSDKGSPERRDASERTRTETQRHTCDAQLVNFSQQTETVSQQHLERTSTLHDFQSWF